MITIEQFTELAHRTASRYSHRSEPARAFLTFSPEALANFHRQVCAAARTQKQRQPLTPAQAMAIAGEMFPMSMLGTAEQFHRRLCEIYGIKE